MASFWLELSTTELEVIGTMLSSFIECDEDYLNDPSNTDGSCIVEVENELKALYSLREKLSNIVEQHNVT